MVINTYGDSHIIDHLEAFKQELKSISGVQTVSASSRVPGDGKSGWSMEFTIKGKVIKTEVPVFIVDQDFTELYDIPVIAGRALTKKIAADSIESMLVNESFVKRLGFNNYDEVIGVKIDMYPSIAKVVGVVKDFNFESLHSKIEPLAMRTVKGQFRKLSIRINTSNVRSTVEDIESEWHNFVPGKPLEYTFLDQDFNNQYAAELNFGRVFFSFTVLAITIACLGLYGLSLITTNQRRKEIAVRKIVGASSMQILALLSQDYLRLVWLSFVVAFPIAYYAMSGWLSSFEFRTSIGVSAFWITAVLVTAISIFTVGLQTLKTSMANPAEAIKNE